MDTNHAPIPLPTAPRAASLRCLDALAIAGPAGLRTVDPVRLARPLELLLRVVAAGPAGESAELVLPALWPGADSRRWRVSLATALRTLDAQLGSRGAIAVDGDRLRVDEAALRVDSLAFERALAPLLNPFRMPLPHEREAARHALAATRGAEFLPGNESAWAGAARMRIADAVARAASILDRPRARGQTPAR